MRALRILGYTLAGLVGVLVVALAVIYVLSARRMGRSYAAVRGHAVAVPTDPAAVLRGEKVATVRGCTNCHTADAGGGVFIDVPPVAQLHAANLTTGRGGVAARYAEPEDWERAIRQGVAPDGRALLFMPAQEFYPMSDADLGDLIAWLKALPPVDREFGPQRVGPIGRVLLLTGKVPLLPAELVDHEAPRPAPVAPGVSVDYGRYLATNCTGCHGEGFAGGRIPGAPPEMQVPLNLTPDNATGLGRWTQADFDRALRTGVRPDGRRLGKDMPVAAFAHFTDDEVAALWLYLRSLPVRPFGSR
jgi:cytochrome c553